MELKAKKDVTVEDDIDQLFKDRPAELKKITDNQKFLKEIEEKPLPVDVASIPVFGTSVNFNAILKDNIWNRSAYTVDMLCDPDEYYLAYDYSHAGWCWCYCPYTLFEGWRIWRSWNMKMNRNEWFKKHCLSIICHILPFVIYITVVFSLLEMWGALLSNTSMLTNIFASTTIFGCLIFLTLGLIYIKMWARGFKEFREDYNKCVGVKHE